MRLFSLQFYFFLVTADFSSFVALLKQTLEIAVRVVFDCDDTDYSSNCDNIQAVKKLLKNVMKFKENSLPNANKDDIVVDYRDNCDDRCNLSMVLSSDCEKVQTENGEKSLL